MERFLQKCAIPHSAMSLCNKVTVCHKGVSRRRLLLPGLYLLDGDRQGRRFTLSQP